MRFRRAAWVLAVCRGLIAFLLFHPPPGQAQGTSKVQGYLFSVSGLYEDLEYEQALRQIARARRLSPTAEEALALSLYEGIILADMSRWEEAAAAFKAALLLNPLATLPVKVSPKVEQHLEVVRQQLQGARAARPPTEVAPRPGSQQPLTEALGNPALAPEAPSAGVTKTASEELLRSPVLLPALGGGGLVVAGGTFWALSRWELSRLRNNDSRLGTREEVRSIASRGRTYQTVSAGLLAAGLVGLGVAVGLHTLGSPPSEVTVGFTPSGGTAFVQGRWP